MLSSKNIPPLLCDVLDDVTILPMLHIDRDPVTDFAMGAFYQGKPLPQVHRFVWGKRFNRQLPYIEATKILKQEVIYAGIFWGHWGHFLTETLQRLWYAAKHTHLPLVWLRSENLTPGMDFFTTQQTEVLNSLGITNVHIYLDQPTKFAKVHFPEPGFGIGDHAHPEHFDFLGHYEGQVTKGRFVYVSRSKVGSCVNELALENILKTYGWEIVFPEQMSVQEQLEIYTSAEVCLMIAGSAQHTLMLTKNSKTRFIVIPRIHNIMYQLIANFASNDYFTLHVETSVSTRNKLGNKDKFRVNTELLQNIIEKTQNFTTSLSEFPSVLKKQTKPLETNYIIPNCYYNDALSVSESERYFYEALFFAQNNQYEEAYKICMILYEKDLLDFFMYDHFFDIVEKYDEKYDFKTKLSLDKNQFLLTKLTQNIEKYPENGENYLRLANLFLKMERTETAITVIHDTIKKFPHWGLAYAELAQIYAFTNDISLAMKFAKKAQRLEPQHKKIKEILFYCMHLQRKKV